MTIPAGVDSGQQLRVNGEGEGGARGGPAGDLYVEVRVKNHSKFQRQGADLICLQPIDYTLALLGGEVELETLDDTVSVKVPAGSNSGDQIKLEHHGMPQLRRGQIRGSLFVQLQVEIPNKLEKEEENLLRQIAEIRGQKVKGKKKGIFS